MISATKDTFSRTDLEWGYEFGCEGVMSMRATREFLNKSDDSVRRLMDANEIRWGRRDSKRSPIMICRRSVLNYLKRLEK